MAEAKSGSRAIWPKVVLWLLVIIFGILYLNAMRDRGADDREGALDPPDPDLVAMTEGPAEGRIPDADAVLDDDAAAPAVTSFEPIPESPAPAGPQADEVAERALAEPARLESERAEADVRPVADPEAASSASQEAEVPGRSILADPPAPMTEPAVTGPAVADDAERSAPRADPGDLSLAERRARLLADYERLLQSVEAERRQIWEEMNRLGGADWPYPYPAPPPFGGPPGGVPGHHWPGR